MTPNDLMSEMLADSDERPLPTADKLRSLSVLVDDLSDADARVESLQDELETAQARAVDIRTRQLPDLMHELGLREFSMEDGRKISVQPKIYASITQAQRAGAFEWLRKNDHGDLIKSVVSLQFGRGEDELKQRVVALLTEQRLQPEEKEGVHPQTLGAFVRSCIEEGVQLPEELFTIHRVDEAKVSRPSK